MGPYCKFCDTRCFVPRWIPDRGELLLATCLAGRDFDMKRTGYDFESAVNPASLRYGERDFDEAVSLMMHQHDAHRLLFANTVDVSTCSCGEWVDPEPLHERERKRRHLRHLAEILVGVQASATAGS